MRLPKPVVGTVDAINGSTVQLLLEDGEQRALQAPEQIHVEVGMRVRIQDFPDGSAPVVMWGG